MKDALRETDLIMPGVASPSNLRRGGRFRTAPVTADVYQVCERLRELSPRLALHWVEDTASPDDIAFVVTETTPDGQEHVVYKVRHITPQIIEDVRYMLGVPFEQRAAEIIKRADANEAAARAAEEEEMIEEIAMPMRRQLWHDGFIEHRDKSYPKLGVVAPGRAR